MPNGPSTRVRQKKVQKRSLGARHAAAKATTSQTTIIRMANSNTRKMPPVLFTVVIIPQKRGQLQANHG
jgi:hypothetical protein